jgi:6-pyruvoyltetrahydropterin/6-carboxytetrahydropterin synthase
LTVKVIGYPNEETGYVIDTKVLSKIIKEKVIDRFDHKNLNLDVIEFEELNPSAENIAMVIYNLLKKEIDPELDLKVILFETERNYVEYPA